MRHDCRLADYGVAIRPVRESDSAFIVALRTQPELAAYIGDTGDLEMQRAWLRDYFERFDDWYFIIERTADHASVGTIAIYNAQRRACAEWGRWVAGAGGGFGVKGLALLYRLAFNVLGFDALCSHTVAENHRLIAFHDRCGLSRVTGQRDSVTIRGCRYDLVTHRISRDQWPSVREGLERRIVGCTEYAS